MASTPSPLVSIITRTKDRHVLLKRALRSVLDQRFTDWEHIIVNDGGDAAALDAFIEPYAEEYQGRLKVIHNPESLGMQQASNRGLASASGKYVGIHDDDDAWRPEFLEACVAFLGGQPEGSPYKGVITHTVRVWEDVDKRGNIVEASREDYLPLPEVNLLRVGFENPFPPIAFLYERAVHKEIGDFAGAFDVAGDLDFNVRFLLRYEIGVIPRKLAQYHWRRKSSDEQLHNSVTAQSRIHGQRLNEWLNHYLRKAARGDTAQIAPALNLARHVIDTQGKADRIVERVSDLKSFTDHALQGLNQKLEQLHEHRERLEDLKQHLSSFNGLAEQGAETHRDLKEHLNAISWRLEPYAGLFDDLKQHLNAISWRLEPYAGLFDDLKQHLNAISWRLEPHEQRFTELKEQLHDLKEHLNSLSGATAAAEVRDQELRAESEALHEDVRWLKNKLSRDATIIKIGRLRLQWRKKPKS